LNENLATIGTALGLALQGITRTANRVNLLPEIYRKKKELKKKQPWIVAAVAALYVLVGLAWYKESEEIDKLKNSEKHGVQTAAFIEGQRKKFEEKKDLKEPREALEAISSIANERDTILKIMDEVNPNIPDNGKWEAADKLDDRIWIVDWKFEEKERPKDPLPAGADPNMARVGMGGPKALPTAKILKATIEVVIKKRGQEVDGRKFITENLLNYNPGKKEAYSSAGGKGCVIKNRSWDLSEGVLPGAHWLIELDHPANEGLVRPEPKGFPGHETDGEKKFQRFKVTLEIPMGDLRKVAQAGDKGTEPKAAK
ncbi:MAG TPA: hypothetical protein VEN81_03385, partial [Planctomycetota bacterium]|nr:hypothetical protein [Planctomycetota bacterium]